ncbi:MAG TPA: GNAT family N-acetyltransferase [Candidatus Nanopelagicales bacterium]|nr:GNAT family N-acetyltransferase [Candidatus Nanopelagicales bacterium]
MSDLRFVPVDSTQRAQAWREVHNLIIPTAPLGLDDVLARAGVNVLDVTYVDDAVVGCSTVRPATDDAPVTVIVRVLPEQRRHGLGSAYLEHAMATARGLGGDRVQTIVLESNVDGLEFALHRGFVETERYVLDGETLAYIHLEREVSG